jgi:hypothetical protein
MADYQVDSGSFSSEGLAKLGGLIRTDQTGTLSLKIGIVENPQGLTVELVREAGGYAVVGSMTIAGIGTHTVNVTDVKPGLYEFVAISRGGEIWGIYETHSSTPPVYQPAIEVPDIADADVVDVIDVSDTDVNDVDDVADVSDAGDVTDVDDISDILDVHDVSDSPSDLGHDVEPGDIEPGDIDPGDVDPGDVDTGDVGPADLGHDVDDVGPGDLSGDGEPGDIGTGDLGDTGPSDLGDGGGVLAGDVEAVGGKVQPPRVYQGIGELIRLAEPNTYQLRAVEPREI